MERVRRSAQANDPELAAKAARLLQEGRVVALPTETVYGLAVRADSPLAVERLVEAKGRPARMPLTWHASSAEALDRYELVSPMARRLAARYWPGPLTMLLPGVPAGLERVASEGMTGLRVPAHPLTQEILAAAQTPIVMTSANRNGDKPAADPDEVERLLGAHIDLLIDTGPARLGEASSVLLLAPPRMELQREGLHTLDVLRRSAGLRIAFVCTGNTCRSPMAMALARGMLAQRLHVSAPEIARFGFEVRSFGVAAAVGSPASQHAREVMRDDGFDLEQHISTAAQAQDFSHYDEVYALTRSHLMSLRAMVPPKQSERFELLDPHGRDVPDPFGGNKAEYRRTADALHVMIEARAQHWA
jgi:tRNA threonylcarbamoyl adenosine modification protein (Sua5/YciO/YrdC/YwlC family)